MKSFRHNTPSENSHKSEAPILRLEVPSPVAVFQLKKLRSGRFARTAPAPSPGARFCLRRSLSDLSRLAPPDRLVRRRKPQDILRDFLVQASDGARGGGRSLPAILPLGSRFQMAGGDAAPYRWKRLATDRPKASPWSGRASGKALRHQPPSARSCSRQGAFIEETAPCSVPPLPQSQLWERRE